MKGSLLIVTFFVLGCFCGRLDLLPAILTADFLPTAVLYALMFQVGLSIGADRKLKAILLAIKPKLLLLPLATVVGTFTGAFLISFFITGRGVFDTMAVGAGFGYYSLSSILITQLKTPLIGAQLAGELGTLALMSNILREMYTLLGTPLFLKYFGKLAPVCAGGVTSMDATLPVITRYCGKEIVFLSIFHGVLLDFSVPFFVSLFCSL